MKPSVTKRNSLYPFLLLFIQPIFMASNIIVARGGVEYVPPVSLAFWRWLTVFIILIPFFFKEIIKKKSTIKKRVLQTFFLRADRLWNLWRISFYCWNVNYYGKYGNYLYFFTNIHNCNVFFIF